MSITVSLLHGMPARLAQASEYLEQRLIGALRSELVQSENHSFALVAESEEHEIVGGLTASTSYEWVLIKILWVEESRRNKGLGKQLLDDAEKYGAALGCHSSWLDTSNPAAHAFYEKNGYKEFGRLENALHHHPPSHRRWFMKKTL